MCTCAGTTPHARGRQFTDVEAANHVINRKTWQLGPEILPNRSATRLQSRRRTDRCFGIQTIQIAVTLIGHRHFFISRRALAPVSSQYPAANAPRLMHPASQMESSLFGE
jgi:hypothetical protein